MLDAGSSNGNSNGTVIEAPAGTTAVKLPADAGQKLSHDKLIVKSDALTLEIPAALLTKLTANLSADQLKDSTITLKLQPLSGTDAANIIDKGEQSSNAAITLAGDVFEFSLTLTSADGTTHAMTQFDTPITIRLSVNAGIDPTTAGIYYIADDGKLEYIGGKVDGSEMVAQISHFSKYAVLQLDVKFSDVRSNYWAYNVIRELAAKQIVNGTSAATFEPNRSITRAEFTSLLVNALRLTATGNAAFSDVSPSAWYAKPVSEAYQAGIVQGRSASTFDPNGTITREEMVTMIVKSYKLLTGSQPAVPASAPFKDMAGVAPWAVDYVKAAAALNLVNGRSEGQFVPKGVSTRAESAQMIYNLLEQH